MIHYSDLSKTAHKILFFLIPLPLLFSHEMMSYMAWPLIGLCLYKYKKMGKTEFFQKALIGSVAVWLFTVSMVQVFLLIFQDDFGGSSENFSKFLDSLFKFVYDPSFGPFGFGSVNFPVIISIVVFILGFLHFFYKKQNPTEQNNACRIFNFRVNYWPWFCVAF